MQCTVEQSTPSEYSRYIPQPTEIFRFKMTIGGGFFFFGTVATGTKYYCTGGSNTLPNMSESSKLGWEVCA